MNRAFEAAVEAIISGAGDRLRALLAEHPGLAVARSHRDHKKPSRWTEDNSKGHLTEMVNNTIPEDPQSIERQADSA